MKKYSLQNVWHNFDSSLLFLGSMMSNAEISKEKWSVVSKYCHGPDRSVHNWHQLEVEMIFSVT